MWTRDDTKLWIHEVFLKLEAYEYYLSETKQWLDLKGIESEKTHFILSWLTVLWVAHQFNEPISKQQVFEIIGFPQWEEVEDVLYMLPTKFGHLEHQALLEIASSQHYDS